MLPVTQMVSNLLLYQVAPKEGHHNEPVSRNAPNEENRAARLLHENGFRQSESGKAPPEQGGPLYNSRSFGPNTERRIHIDNMPEEICDV
jgi:hypothetical protein